MAGTNGRRRFSDKWGKHELDVLAVLSSAYPQWLTSRQIAQRVKAYADSYGELADQAAKAAFAKQFQRDRAKLAAMGIAIESRQPEYSTSIDGQDFASYRLRLGNETRVKLHFDPDEMSVLAAANYLAQSVASANDAYEQERQERERTEKASRTAPKVPHAPTPGLGLDSIAPGLGTQKIPKNLAAAVDARHYSATTVTEGDLYNVVYTDSDDLAMFVLTHPGTRIVGPQEAIDAYKRRLNATLDFESATFDTKSEPVPVSDRVLTKGMPIPSRSSHKHSAAGQSSSEVDRRLRMMLFLSAHIGGQYSLDELAERFIGHARTPEEKRRNLKVIRKDIGTLTTVSDDGEIAGSQFFDIDWDLLDDDGIVCAMNSLGLDRLAGISQRYLNLLEASVSYLAESSLLPDDQKEIALKLYRKLAAHNTSNQEVPTLSLTRYEREPEQLEEVRKAIASTSLMKVDYTDATGTTRPRHVLPVKIFVDEGVYYVACWNVISTKTNKLLKRRISKFEKGKGDDPAEWFTLRVSRINNSPVLTPIADEDLEIPPVPVENLRRWSFDKGTKAVFVTNEKNLQFIDDLPSATVEPWGDGDKVHILINSDSWFVAFCISHARHISAVGPDTLHSMMTARARRELSLYDD